MSCSVRRHLIVLPALSLVLFFGLLAQPASAATVIVGTCKSGIQFSTIGAAITAVPANSTIDICPGVYPEQLTISKSLTFQGLAFGAEDGVYIEAPAAGVAANASDLASGNPLAAHVWVSGPATVNFYNLTVDSLNNGITGCAPDLIGILYQNANGTMNHIATRNQWIGASESDPNLNGCQSGLGIFVESGNSGTSTVTVENSSVHDYQKNGITGNEAGTTLTVSSNDVGGQGATNGAAENGVQLAFGAAGSVTGNLVIDDVWAPDTNTDTGNAASGILIYDTTGSLSVKNNTVGNTQFGIVIDTDTGNSGAATVTGNKVFGTRIFDGIDICSNSNTITSNTVLNSSESAIHLDATCGSTGNGNSVSGNTLIDACVGLLEDAGISGNTIGTNTYFADGLTVGGSCTAAPAGAASMRNLPAYGTFKHGTLEHGHRVPAKP
jgi:hypothetical protein